MIIKNLQKNKACPTKRGRCGGFVILFAVTLAAILLSIALGVSNVALREIKFGTSAKDTNEAFFAADIGDECALVNDKSTSNVFMDSGLGTPIQINCNNSKIDVAKDSGRPFWRFNVSGLGNGGQSCASVTVDKTVVDRTTVISKGYNFSCVSTSPNLVEREIKVSY